MLSNQNKLWISFTAVLLAVVTAMFFIFSATPKIKTRTVAIEVPPQYVELVETLFDNTATLEGDDDTVSFIGTTVALLDEEVTFDCLFTAEDLMFNIDIISDEFSENEQTEGFVNAYGGLDAEIVYGDTSFFISDYKSVEELDALLETVESGTGLENLAWGRFRFALVVVAIVVYVVVSSLAEQIKAESNYRYNCSLESSSSGVALGNYIYDQTENQRSGYKCADYRFGFTTFAGVGCEVASAYNAMIALGRQEMLSNTIYHFEKWAIEFAFGWGNFGSNPREIYRYFNKMSVSYQRYTSLNSFVSAVNNAGNNAHIIMSRWNSPLTAGLHTFYVKKISNNSFNGYNWTYSDGVVNRSSITAFNNGSGFIVGYIVNG